MRCFGERQTLKLMDTQGKPARWTIILGENGTGKTTLLQCLVGFQRKNLFVYTGSKQRTEDGGAFFTYSALEGIVTLFQRSDDKQNGGSPSTFPRLEASAFYAGRLDAETFETLPGYAFLDGESAHISHHPGLNRRAGERIRTIHYPANTA